MSSPRFAHWRARTIKNDAADAKAPRTWCQYRSVWKLFVEWCEETGVPATPATLKAYVCALTSRGLSPATAEAYFAGMITVHRLHGYPLDRTMLVEPMKAAR